jgi:hypothetical protein
LIEEGSLSDLGKNTVTRVNDDTGGSLNPLILSALVALVDKEVF